MGDNLALARGPGPGADHLLARFFEPFGVSGCACYGRGGLLFPRGAGDRTTAADGRRRESSRLQAAWMKRQIDLADPFIAIVMSAPAPDRGGIGGCWRSLRGPERRTQVFPVLGPRVDLLKDGPPRLGTVPCALSEGPRFAGCLYIGASGHQRSQDCLFAGAVFQLAACQADGSWRRTVGRSPVALRRVEESQVLQV